MKWMLGVMLALGLGGCSKLDNTKVSGDGAVIEQRHPLGREVTRVLAGVPANIHLVAGAASGIHIRGQGNLLPYLELTEKGDKLEIEVKEGYRLDPPEPIDITITLPKVEELALAGLARGDLSGFSGDELVLSVAGVGDIVADGLELDRLEGNIAGAGSLDRKRPAKAVLTGETGYSAGRATRQGSSSLTRFTGQSAITFSTCRR